MLTADLGYDGAALGRTAMNAALSLRNEIAELPRLLEVATDFARDAGLSNQELSRLLVIIDELFSNIVLHGYDRPDARGEVAISLSCEDGLLEMEIVDDGRAFNPLTAPPPDLDLPASERPVGGLGIHFVRQLVDHAEYLRQDGRNRLLLQRRIHRTTASV